MNLSQATTIANRIVKHLAPHCQRIAIGGSMRRKKAQVKDIEIVCIPKQVEIPGQTDIFGEALPTHVRDPKFSAAIRSYKILKGSAFTGKYIKCQGSDDIAIDIFTATPENWGYILLLRTGSKEFNMHLMRCLKSRNFSCREGKVYYRGGVTPVREEREMFRFAGIGYQEPEKRNAKQFKYWPA